MKKIKELKGAFHLPVEFGVLVPSTTKANKRISAKQFKKRTDMVRTYLSSKFGGYTSVVGVGGYMSDTKGLIKEDVSMVVSYSQESDFKKYKSEVIKKVKSWGKSWKQEAMGVIVENDLYYVNSKR